MAGDMLPYFRFYPAETLSDERFQSWTLAERGAWLTLICYAWREGSIPGDLPSLAKLLRIDGNAMATLWQCLGNRFVEHPDYPGRLCSLRQEEEREKAQAAIAKKVSAGKKGAESRWAKLRQTNGTANAIAMANDSPQPYPQPQPQPQPASLTENGNAIAMPTAAGGQHSSQEAQTGSTELLRVTLQRKLGRHIGGCGRKPETAEALTKHIDRLGFENTVLASLQAADELERKGDPLRSLAALPGWLDTVMVTT